MRRHVICTFDDSDPPSLGSAAVDELQAICAGQVLPEERETPRGADPRPNNRGFRFFGRYAENGVNRGDVEAFGVFAAEMLARREERADRIRIERDGLAPGDPRRGVLDGVLSALEAGTSRGGALLSAFMADARAGMAAAAESDRHP